jgi:Phage Terminase
MIADKFVGFGQGFKDMSPALRDLESIILERKLRHGGHPVLSMCAMNAVIDRDPAGNRKLSKKHAAGRIDGMIALLMAIGVAPMKTAKIDVEALIAQSADGSTRQRPTTQGEFAQSRTPRLVPARALAQISQGAIAPRAALCAVLGRRALHAGDGR